MLNLLPPETLAALTATADLAGATVRMLRFTPVLVQGRLRRLAAGDAPALEAQTYALCEAITVSIDVPSHAGAEVQALGAYWAARTGDEAADYLRFCALITPAVMAAWWAAYEATRADAARGDATSADPQPEGAGR